MSVRALRFYARDIECTRSIVCALARTLQMSYFLWLNARRWEMCLCECATHTIARTPTMSISINDLVPNVRASNSQAVRPAMARSHRYVPCCSPCAICVMGLWTHAFWIQTYTIPISTCGEVMYIKVNLLRKSKCVLNWYLWVCAFVAFENTWKETRWLCLINTCVENLRTLMKQFKKL